MVSAHRPEEQTVTVFHIPELLRRRTVVRTLCFHRSGCGFHPWLGKLRSHMPRGAAKKKKKYSLFIALKFTCEHNFFFQKIRFL